MNATSNRVRAALSAVAREPTHSRDVSFALRVLRLSASDDLLVALYKELVK
jgi:hypothetical protein